MTPQRRVGDWRTLGGASVEIRGPGGIVVCSGLVDVVTDDGKILWLQSPIEGRRLIEKAVFHQAWAVEERTGFHYRLSKDEQRNQDSQLQS